MSVCDTMHIVLSACAAVYPGLENSRIQGLCRLKGEACRMEFKEQPC
jgi:hypothetical protein